MCLRLLGFQALMLLKFLRLLGSYVPKAPRLPGTYAPKSPLCPRLLCSERIFLKVLFLMYVHKGLSLRSFLMICSLMTIPNMPKLLKPSQCNALRSICSQRNVLNVCSLRNALKDFPLDVSLRLFLELSYLGNAILRQCP